MEFPNNLSDQFEPLLRSYYKSYEPDPTYLARIRTDLLTAASKKETKHPGFSGNWFLANWRYAVAAALLLIIVAVTVIGPARVWAQFESWIAYLPGLGSVELSGTRALEEPAVHSEGGISFQVEKFVASPDETFISIHITGLPSDVSPSSGSIYIQWDDPDGQRKGVPISKEQVFSRFHPCPPEGCPRDIQPDGYELNIVYGPLPQDVNQVQVQWLTYGMAPDAAPTDTWTLDISLIQISDENTQNFIQPGYSPLSAEDSQHGITITVDNVFSGASRTVIDGSIAVPESASPPDSQEVFLSSSTGDLLEPTYFSHDMDLFGVPSEKITPAVTGAPTLRVWPTRWQFSPVDPQASRMTLTIESVRLTYDLQNQFNIEIGQDPELGTSIPLDVSIDVEGFPLHIYQARIVMAPAFIQGTTKDVKAIEFLVESELTVDGKHLRGIWFSPNDNQVFVEPSIEREELSIGRLVLDSYMIRDGKIQVTVDSVVLEQQGPWVISWDIPQETY